MHLSCIHVRVQDSDTSYDYETNARDHIAQDRKQRLGLLSASGAQPSTQQHSSVPQGRLVVRHRCLGIRKDQPASDPSNLLSSQVWCSVSICCSIQSAAYLQHR